MPIASFSNSDIEFLNFAVLGQDVYRISINEDSTSMIFQKISSYFNNQNIRLIVKASPSFVRAYASLTSLWPRFIFFAGGTNQNEIVSDVVERYDAMSDRWESLPSMNVARAFYSSCTLGKTMYVLGGLDINF